MDNDKIKYGADGVGDYIDVSDRCFRFVPDGGDVVPDLSSEREQADLKGCNKVVSDAEAAEEYMDETDISDTYEELEEPEFDNTVSADEDDDGQAYNEEYADRDGSTESGYYKDNDEEYPSDEEDNAADDEYGEKFKEYKNDYCGDENDSAKIRNEDDYAENDSDNGDGYFKADEGFSSARPIEESGDPFRSDFAEGSSYSDEGSSGEYVVADSSDMPETEQATSHYASPDRDETYDESDDFHSDYIGESYTGDRATQEEFEEPVDEPEEEEPYEEEPAEEPEEIEETYEEEPVDEPEEIEETFEEEPVEEPEEETEKEPEEIVLSGSMTEEYNDQRAEEISARQDPENEEFTEEEKKEQIRRKYMVVDDGLNVAKIMVIGVGGAGNNAVNRMIRAGVNTAHFVAINTDKQALLLSLCDPEDRYQIGALETKGLGAGAEPEIGEKAANESKELIEQIVDGVDLLFITAGMGGGTGTGAAPVIAKIAKEKGCVTVAVVTKPFSFEGNKRAKNAEKGIANLEKHVDTIIIIPNDKLMEAMKPNTPFVEALSYADDTLRQGICGIADLIATPSLINLDFADVKTTLKNQGLAHMGIGSARGENRIVEAVKGAVSSPLLETTIEGAKSVIFNVTGGTDLTLTQINDAAKSVRDIVDPEANVIFGANINPELQEEVIITLIATGFDSDGSGIAEENARAYNELFAVKREDDEEEEKPAEQPVYEEHTAWAPNRSYAVNNSAQYAENTTDRPNVTRGEYLNRDRQSFGAQNAGYARPAEQPRASSAEYPDERYAAEYRQPQQPAPSAYESAPARYEKEEDKPKKDLPSFVKRLFGGKKKD